MFLCLFPDYSIVGFYIKQHRIKYNKVKPYLVDSLKSTSFIEKMNDEEKEYYKSNPTINTAVNVVVYSRYKEEKMKHQDNSEKIKWLRGLKMKDLGNGECCKCDKAAFCAPCMVRNANESPTGNPLEINRHFCAVAAKNKQIVLDWRKAKLKEIGK